MAGYSAEPVPAVPASLDSSTSLAPERLKQCFGVIERVDTQVERVMEKGSARDPIDIALSSEDRECILEVYRDICNGLQQKKFKTIYQFDRSHDTYLCSDRARQRVETYFANLDTGQSIWKRKMLSIHGLENLTIFGQEVFNELSANNFSGCLADYGNEVRDCETPQSKGMHKMKYYTGNSVDLDTVVLRCSDRPIFDAINASNKHQDLPTYRSPDQFGASKQARQIAINAAFPLVDAFCADFQLEGAARTQRRLDLNVESLEQCVPLARSNKDRGKWVLWQYVNIGVNSFHVNVPNMPDVYGALLLSPWHLAKAWCTIHSEFEPGEERDKWVADFFDDAVGDSCFNMKWKNIEEFSGRLKKLGTIVDRLQKLQQRKQKEFGELYARSDVSDDEKDRLESALLFRLCQEESLTGRDKDGVNREITRADSDKFVTDPSTVI